VVMLWCPALLLGQQGPPRQRWVQGWQRRAIAVVRIEAGTPQIPCGQGEGCVDKPGPETRGAHQGQCVGDGDHGLRCDLGGWNSDVGGHGWLWVTRTAAWAAGTMRM
jgi:hypothetical protein